MGLRQDDDRVLNDRAALAWTCGVGQVFRYLQDAGQVLALWVLRTATVDRNVAWVAIRGKAQAQHQLASGAGARSKITGKAAGKVSMGSCKDRENLCATIPGWDLFGTLGVVEERAFGDLA